MSKPRVRPRAIGLSRPQKTPAPIALGQEDAELLAALSPTELVNAYRWRTGVADYLCRKRAQHAAEAANKTRPPCPACGALMNQRTGHGYGNAGAGLRCSRFPDCLERVGDTRPLAGSDKKKPWS